MQTLATLEALISEKVDDLARWTRQAIRAERERCAKIAEEPLYHNDPDAGGMIARRIRERT